MPNTNVYVNNQVENISVKVTNEVTNITVKLSFSNGGGGGGSGNANILRKYKTGANVISNSISLASDNIPEDCIIQVYVNGVTGYFSPSYNENTKIVDNLPDTVNSDIIKFVITY